jgi:hypothetical protein
VGTIGHPSNGALSASTGTFTGNVGVGVTTAPDANLQVGGALDSAGSYRGALALKTQTVGSITPGEAALYIEETSGGEGYYVGVDSTGGMFFNNSGSSTTLQLGDDGAVTMPNQPAFNVNNSNATQSNIAVGSLVTVTFGVERFDQNADFASNTFTAPVTGKYLLTYTLRLGAIDDASEYYLTRIATSNRNYSMLWDSNEFSSDQDYVFMTNTALADMDANDTATVIVYQNSGTQQTDVQDDSYFTGHLVC